MERVSGVDYPDYVRERILDPLGIDAGFEVSQAMQARKATAYMRRWDPFRPILWLVQPRAVSKRLYRGRVGGLLELRDYNLCAAPIGGLVGSVEAFARFVQFQLGGDDAVLSADRIREMQALTVRGKAGIESNYGVGLGWKHGRCGDVPFLNHEGGGAGFTTETRIYPEEGLGMVLAMNTMRMPGTMRAAHQMCELIRTAGGS